MRLQGLESKVLVCISYSELPRHTSFIKYYHCVLFLLLSLHYPLLFPVFQVPHFGSAMHHENAGFASNFCVISIKF